MCVERWREFRCLRTGSNHGLVSCTHLDETLSFTKYVNIFYQLRNYQLLMTVVTSVSTETNAHLFSHIQKGFNWY